VVRVLHVLDEIRASGAEVMLNTAASTWAQYGVECDVLATGRRLGPYADELKNAGYGIHHIPFTGDVRFLIEYAKLLRRQSYDVVHVHLERASVYLCLTGRLCGSQVVRTIHTSFPFQGRLAKRRARQRRLASRIGTRFVAIGESVAANEKSRFGNATIRIENWIDVERFKPPTSQQRVLAREALGIRDESPTLVTVGNCAWVKNHDGLLEALAGMADIDWTWLHVGQEDDAGVEREMSKTLGIDDRCRFLGRCNPINALHAADLGVMPSHYEGLPLASIESLSTGLPMVLTDVPGNRDLRSDGVQIAWAGSSPGELQSAIRTALAAAVRESQRQRQHEVIAERFNRELGVNSYASLYETLATPRPVGKGLGGRDS
jgi:glycosyltransferase involved in cell wall biosynthesis